MPERNEELKAFYRLLRQRQGSGHAGRLQIANRLAKMTLAELLRVPPWVIVRLGPKGLALLAERSAVIRMRNGGSVETAEGVAGAAVAAPQPKLSWFAELERRRPLWWECLRKMGSTAVIGALLIAAFPFVQRGLQIEGPASDQDSCTRLDHWTGNCTYRVGSSGLNLSEAAVRLALPVAALAAANPHLDPNRPLLPGTLISVPPRAGINLR